MNYWNDLSLKEKADIMKVAIGNGIYSLSNIRKTYNKYVEGGDTKDKWTIQDEANYREWRDNLPENLKYTDDREYDMIGAYKAGLQPEWNEKDQSYHLGSRDPQTGRILKSSTHPTYSEAIWTDAAMGYYPTYKNGETYTQQLPWENEYSRGGKIHIKPSHRGKFTRLKERTGHSASWFKENGTPAQKKMAIFELNARKWKHGDGGPLIQAANSYAEGGPYKPGTIYGRPVEEGLKIVSPEFDALLIGKAASNAVKEAAGELLNSGIEGTARQRAAITSRRFGREMTKRSNEVKGWSRTLMDDINDGNYADVPLDLKGLTRNVWETGRYIKNTPERYVENTLPKFYRNVFRRTYNNIKPAVPMIFKDDNDE